MLERDFPGCDFTEVLANPLNVCLVHGDSGAIFAWRGPGIYEVHVFYAMRGREALSVSRIMLDIMRKELAVSLALTGANDVANNVGPAVGSRAARGPGRRRERPQEAAAAPVLLRAALTRP